MFEKMKIGTWEVIGFFENVVLAHDPNSPTPYVTWFYNGTDVESGNYFDDEYDAVKDLIERAGYGY